MSSWDEESATTNVVTNMDKIPTVSTTSVWQNVSVLDHWWYCHFCAVFIIPFCVSLPCRASSKTNAEQTDTTTTTTTMTTTTRMPNGNTIYAPQTTYSAGSSSVPVFAADVNNDNKPDIIVAKKYGNNIGNFLNSGNGTFLSQNTYSTGTNTWSVFVADVNGDYTPDLISGNIGGCTVGVFLAC